MIEVAVTDPLGKFHMTVDGQHVENPRAPRYQGIVKALVDSYECGLGDPEVYLANELVKQFAGVAIGMHEAYPEPLGEASPYQINQVAKADRFNPFNDLIDVDKLNTCHNPPGPGGGRFCSHKGRAAAHAAAAPKEKAWDGGTTALTEEEKPNKQETGAIGEKMVIDYLKQLGHSDAKHLNVQVNNFPVDLVQNHHAIEVKTGLVSNGKSSQHWRATIGEPGKEEKAWLATVSKAEKKAHNDKKYQAILDRKQAALEQLSEKFGRPVTGKTYSLIINPKTRTADLYQFDGFHLRIPWKGPQAKAGFVTTLRY